MWLPVPWFATRVCLHFATALFVVLFFVRVLIGRFA